MGKGNRRWLRLPHPIPLAMGWGHFQSLATGIRPCFQSNKLAQQVPGCSLEKSSFRPQDELSCSLTRRPEPYPHTAACNSGVC